MNFLLYKKKEKMGRVKRWKNKKKERETQFHRERSQSKKRVS
jgi:hypothetical protein